MCRRGGLQLLLPSMSCQWAGTQTKLFGGLCLHRQVTAVAGLKRGVPHRCRTRRSIISLYLPLSLFFVQVSPPSINGLDFSCGLQGFFFPLIRNEMKKKTTFTKEEEKKIKRNEACGCSMANQEDGETKRETNKSHGFSCKLRKRERERERDSTQRMYKLAGG